MLRTREQATKQVLAREHVRQRLAAAGVGPYEASGADPGRRVTEETTMRAGVIDKAGVKFDSIWKMR